MVVDPMGVIIADAGDREGVIFANVDAGLVSRTRERLPFLKDMR